MKKIFTLIGVLFTLNCAAQDTTYYAQRNKLYYLIRTEVRDSSEIAKYQQDYLIHKKKTRRLNRIAFSIFIMGAAAIIIADKTTKITGP